MQIRRWGIVAVTCLTITLSLGGYKALQIKQAIAFGESFPEHSQTVETAQLQQTQWTPSLKVLAEVVVPRTINLRNELAGKIVEVGFTAGATVAKGQLLVRLDTRETQARLKAANAQSRIARLDLERISKLVKQNLSTADEFDKAEAQLTIALANAEELQTQIDKKTLTAPFAATTDLHQLEAGQFLAANSLISQLVGIENHSWVDFMLPQAQSSLTVGTIITATAPGLLPTPVQGVISAKDSSVVSQSRHIRFRAQLPLSTDVLRPGAIVNINVPSAQTHQVMMLPATAIRRDSFGASVYVLNQSESGSDAPFRANKRQITVGAALGENVIITSGLVLTDIIATNGSYKLQHGMLAHVTTPTTNGLSLAESLPVASETGAVIGSKQL